MKNPFTREEEVPQKGKMPFSVSNFWLEQYSCTHGAQSPLFAVLSHARSPSHPRMERLLERFVSRVFLFI